MRLIPLITLLIVSFSVRATTLDTILEENSTLPPYPLSMNSLMPATVQLSFAAKQQLKSTIQGRTRLLLNKESSVLKPLGADEPLEDGRQSFPSINFDWVQNEYGEVIPTIRHLIVSNNPHWDYFLGVGKVWNDASGNLINRISMPFTLVEKNENCTHNGVLVFTTNAPNGDFYFQITSETCAYFKADFWGKGDVINEATQHLDSEKIISQYRQEKNQRLNTKPITLLSQQATKMDTDKLALAKNIAADDMTAFGLLIENVHYVSDCNTRTGIYPFCEQLVLPSYSTAKSLFAAISVFYLQQQYGDTLEQPVIKWVERCRGGQWQGVTFAHLLNMTTGNYQSAKYSADEASGQKLAFFTAKTNRNRLTFACEHFPRKGKPGETFVYHTSDTYLLGVGLSAYIKSKLGEDADLFTDVLYKRIFAPLGLSQVTAQSRRTADNTRQPYVGYGLFFTRDDLARLSQFVGKQAQVSGTASILANTPLSAALQRLDSDRGLTTDYTHIRYHHGFWARRTANASGCQNPNWVPFMSGYGGITIALLADASIYYYVSDSYHFDWSDAVSELEKRQLTCANRTAKH